jgi:hypothetical protein
MDVPRVGMALARTRMQLARSIPCFEITTHSIGMRLWRYFIMMPSQIASRMGCRAATRTVADQQGSLISALDADY